RVRELRCPHRPRSFQPGSRLPETPARNDPVCWGQSNGNGVYTRYAHLQEFSTGLEVGKSVKAGEVIALMGNTASYKVARHLHYEVLTGDWGAQAGSFALTPVNLLTLPAAKAGS
ncbi:MAG: M23 family metallopeptidase, partial [Hyphomonas sp.]|uniref:M23 family metallopeptidase n=1 Tax=Hyphomonas sp. TaxID=87 RepID=UPI00349FE2E3